MVIPSAPGLPLFLLTRFHALSRFSRSHTSSISCSVKAEFSVADFAMNGSVSPSPRAGASPRSFGSKASTCWLFCRVLFTRYQSYLLSQSFGPYALSVPRPGGQTALRPSQSPEGDTAQISRGKLNRLRCTTAGSTLRILDGSGLRDVSPARPTLAPHIRFLFIGSHL